MGFKNNTIEYGFGQMGSILITGVDNDVTCRGVANSTFQTQNAVFTAIQFIENTVFDTAGLISENNDIYVNSSTGSVGIDADGGASTDTVTFPKGLTIYGRWTSIKLDSDKVIAYIRY